MRVATPAVVAACLFLVSANADAQQRLKTIQIGADSDYTIGMPSQLDQVPKNELPDGSLMAFVGTVGNDDFLCQLLLQNYIKKATGRQSDITAFATGNGRNTWCSADNVSNLHVLHSEETTSNGLPAATCAAAYTKADGTGKLVDNMMIATKKGSLLLVCQVENPSQNDVEAEWPSWQASFEDVQNSLHLPRTVK